MVTITYDRSNPAAVRPVIVFAVLAFALALRMMHLSSALHSPLSYQPGPDEDYYFRFGKAVAAGQGEDSPEFTFMDPGYGYLLGGLFKLIGANSFAVYLLQALLDTATAYGILCGGRLLGRPRAGLYGALFYAVTSTAIMFCAALLKEICVASYVTWWVVGALVLCRSDRKPAWAWKAALIALGIAVSLAPWSVRNYRAFGSLSPLPHNGGIVLHQIYNAQNPSAAIWVPSFANYLHPSEIWSGYAAEANRRTGRPLSPPDVDRHWRDEALDFMRTHPGQVAAEIARKWLSFLADTEVPNNRSAADERLFSPILRVLPSPTAWLLAMGLAGLAWFAVEGKDRRWLIVAAPIAISWVTVADFWADARPRQRLMDRWDRAKSSRWPAPAALRVCTSLKLPRDFIG